MTAYVSVLCPDCAGRGHQAGTTCSACDGTGQVGAVVDTDTELERLTRALTYTRRDR